MIFSPNHFDSIDKLIKNETNKGVDVEMTGVLFKEHLFEAIKKKFTSAWNDLQMKEKLAELEYCKHNLVCDKAWRPTNISAVEQIDAHAISELKKQRAFFRRQIEFQNKQIAVSSL